MLHDLMVTRGAHDSYSYHVYGSQGLSWARRGISSPEDRVSYLKELLRHLDQGIKFHPGNRELQSLHEDVTREILLLGSGAAGNY